MMFQFQSKLLRNTTGETWHRCLRRALAMLSPILTTSRWIKFEEKVEEGGERWSKPHVSTLSLHSLFELRACLQTGTVLLDLDSGSLPQIIGEARASLLGSPQARATPQPRANPHLILRRWVLTLVLSRQCFNCF